MPNKKKGGSKGAKRSGTIAPPGRAKSRGATHLGRVAPQGSPLRRAGNDGGTRESGPRRPSSNSVPPTSRGRRNSG